MNKAEEVHQLRGNIRAFCRVRPSNSDGSSIIFPELPPKQKKSEIKPDQFLTTIEIKDSSNKQIGKFSFDRVFPEKATQSAICSGVSLKFYVGGIDKVDDSPEQNKCN